MTLNVKYYKLVLLKNFLDQTHQAKLRLFDELTVHATDPVLYKRRFRMLTHLNQYEEQIIKKIQNFETSDPGDLSIESLTDGLRMVLNRNA